MVKQNLSLADLVREGEFYLSSVNDAETRDKILKLIDQFKLDLVYDSMKKTVQWADWCKVSENVKIYYEECVKTDENSVRPIPRIFLRNWADGKDTRVAVIKIERDVLKIS